MLSLLTAHIAPPCALQQRDSVVLRLVRRSSDYYEFVFVVGVAFRLHLLTAERR